MTIAEIPGWIRDEHGMTALERMRSAENHGWFHPVLDVLAEAGITQEGAAEGFGLSTRMFKLYTLGYLQMPPDLFDVIDAFMWEIEQED